MLHLVLLDAFGNDCPQDPATQLLRVAAHMPQLPSISDDGDITPTRLGYTGSLAVVWPPHENQLM